jgi:uncharacterized protein YndB with AHSA1/START domain
MSDRAIRLHRVLRANPEKVYRAFLNADALTKWLPPYGFVCKVHHLDARVGGTFRMSFNNFSSGNGHSFGGEYLELIPDELVRYTDTFDDPALPGIMAVTVSLKPVLCGSEIDIVQAGIPEAIPLEMCYRWFSWPRLSSRTSRDERTATSGLVSAWGGAAASLHCEPTGPSRRDCFAVRISHARWACVVSRPAVLSKA